MIGDSRNLIKCLKFKSWECRVLCGKALPLLKFISIRMEISLGVVWLKSVFHVCTDLLRTPHGLTKKKLHFILIILYICIIIFETNSYKIFENNIK